MNELDTLPWYRHFWAWVVIILPLSMVISVSWMVIYMLLHPMAEVNHQQNTNSIQTLLNQTNE